MNKRFIVLFILLFLVLGNYIMNQDKPACQSTWSLRFLYSSRIGSAMRSFITNNSLVSTLAGKFADTRVSKYAIPLFKRSYDVNVNESELVKPLKSFTSLNDFFSRQLKPIARPFNQNEDFLCSPADGYIWVAPIDEQLNFHVKNAQFTLPKFLNDTALAQEFIGGTIIVVRIAPHHYHRFHAPCSGIPETIHMINGKYESVNMISYLCGVPVLQQNERGLIKLQDTPFGSMCIIPVGALCVGRIKTTYTPDIKITKGDEMGYFEFGGSTVVMLLKKDAINIDPVIQSSIDNDYEYEVQAGQVIAHKVQAINA